MLGLFVTGTDTGVGKTRVCCWLAESLRRQDVHVGVCKPATTGAELIAGNWIWGDVQALANSIGSPQLEPQVGPLRWRAPAAPPVAAKLDGVQSPTLSQFLEALDSWQQNCEFLIVEGIGGLLCPLTATQTVADLVQLWGRPLLIVARAGLGTLNHTLLTVEAAERRTLPVFGVLLNHPAPSTGDAAERTNAEELRSRLSVPVWGPLDHEPSARRIDELIRQMDLMRRVQQHETRPAR